MGSFCGERGLFRKQAALLERCACFVNRRRFWEEFFFCKQAALLERDMQKACSSFLRSKKGGAILFFKKIFFDIAFFL